MLINIVRQNLNKTNDEIISLLDEDVVLKLDNNTYTIAQIKLVVSDIDALRLICGTIKAAVDADPLVWAFSQKLFTTGISFADPETQFIITGLAEAGKWPTEVTSAIKSIGIVYGKKWQQLGLQKLPDSQDIDNIRSEVEKESNIQDVINLFTSLMQETGVCVGSTVNDILTPAIKDKQSLGDIKSNINIDKLDELIQYINNIKAVLV